MSTYHLLPSEELCYVRGSKKGDLPIFPGGVVRLARGVLGGPGWKYVAGVREPGMWVRPVIPCLESVLGSSQRGNRSLKHAPAHEN